jgi:hypothetical protein
MVCKSCVHHLGAVSGKSAASVFQSEMLGSGALYATVHHGLKNFTQRVAGTVLVHNHTKTNGSIPSQQPTLLGRSSQVSHLAQLQAWLRACLL